MARRRDLAFAKIALWFLARPVGVHPLRLACVAALSSAAAGLVLNQAIAQLWLRERPYAEHPGSPVLFTGRSQDTSFPSDHSTAAFAIAVAVLFFHRRVGAALLVAAAAIALSRVLIAMHYPTGVIAGALTGTAAAIAVCKLGGPLVVYVTGLIARRTDPLLRTIWHAGARMVRH